MDFILRNFDPADAPQVNSIAVNAFSQFKGKYSDWDTFLQGVGKMSELARTAELIVAETNGKIGGAVGYVGPNIEKAYFPFKVPCIRMLVVDPEARGNGLGRALTQACIDRAIRDGAEQIGLHTSPIMEVALPLYLRMGFTKHHDIKPIRGVPYAIYYKRLNQLA